ncbi:MAG: hypothetical protein R2705_11585 [Ilumatobacteraceae bacterium]
MSTSSLTPDALASLPQSARTEYETLAAAGLSLDIISKPAASQLDFANGCPTCRGRTTKRPTGPTPATTAG